MRKLTPPPAQLEPFRELGELILKASAGLVLAAVRAHRPRRRSKTGTTLRPGRATPLWNALRAQIEPLLKPHGAQANLARLLGLQRQQVNAFVTTGGRMPDAERTLQLLAWLIAQRAQQPPA